MYAEFGVGVRSANSHVATGRQRQLELESYLTYYYFPVIKQQLHPLEETWRVRFGCISGLFAVSPFFVWKAVSLMHVSNLIQCRVICKRRINIPPHSCVPTHRKNDNCCTYGWSHSCSWGCCSGLHPEGTHTTTSWRNCPWPPVLWTGNWFLRPTMISWTLPSRTFAQETNFFYDILFTSYVTILYLWLNFSCFT